MVVICREMGWDYWTYQSQPIWFITGVADHLNQEAKKIQEQNRKLNKK